MPTITIVAKTGLLIETRVIHMAVLPGGGRVSPRPASGRTSARDAGSGRRRGRLDDRRRAVLQVVEARGEHRRVRRQRGLDLDAAGGVVAAAGRRRCA